MNIKAIEKILGDTYYKPFLYKNKTVITNGKFLIFYNNDIGLNYVEDYKVPNVSQFYNDAIKPFKNIQLVKDIECEHQFCHDEKENIDCEDCEGSGMVYWHYENYEREDLCPVCDGDGTKGEYKYCPNENIKFGRYIISTKTICSLKYYLEDVSLCGDDTNKIGLTYVRFSFSDGVGIIAVRII